MKMLLIANLIIFSLCGNVLAQKIENYRDNLQKGYDQLEISEFDKASLAFTNVIDAFHEDEQAFAKKLYLGNGLTNEEMDQFVEISIYYTQALYLSGVIDLTLNRPYEAIYKLSAVMDFDSTNVDAMAALSYIYTQIYQYPRALEIITNALNLKPDNVDFLMDRASILGNLKMYDVAIEDIDKAISIDDYCSDC
ncbi:tetratricopeptide repeat protein [Fulvivirga ligni]|uniref:tetratricopeptide repeat protein n=1 Tax=Fulvivirga ligni TaxID=2904246 RepID=UPI001F4007E8|nr:hypothetical protein [Fulvivirga ligni]UII23185.1 hypothetical protein LVD16_08090 [Fulvivirga ligni]